MTLKISSVRYVVPALVLGYLLARLLGGTTVDDSGSLVSAISRGSTDLAKSGNAINSLVAAAVVPVPAAEISQLKQEIADLKFRLDALTRRMDNGEAARSAAPSAASAGDIMEAAEQSVLREEEAGARLLRDHWATLEASFQAQFPEPQWAENAAALIRSSWARIQPNDASLTQLECRASICRMEVESQTRADLDVEFFPALAVVLPAVMRKPVTNDAADDLGPAVFFLSREPLPAPEVAQLGMAQQ